jgi:hypothetical protein
MIPSGSTYAAGRLSKCRSIREALHRFMSDTPGHRFIGLRNRRQAGRQGNCHTERCVNVLGGGLVAIFGIAMLPAPGPGSLIFTLGMALLGTEFEGVARIMDAAELRMRRCLDDLRQRLVSALGGRKRAPVEEA